MIGTRPAESEFGPDRSNVEGYQSSAVALEADLPAPGVVGTLTEDSQLAIEVKSLVRAGRLIEARERFAALVALQQRRASRIAYHFLRDAADADEAVQDAFVKVFSHIGSFREQLPFEVWFTRILINGCLDRRKARRRRERWIVPAADTATHERAWLEATPANAPSPEDMLLRREGLRQIAAAVDRLPSRQRTVFLLCHYDDRSPREVSQLTGLNESTVRVHLFRAVRNLRMFLEANRGTR